MFLINMPTPKSCEECMMLQRLITSSGICVPIRAVVTSEQMKSRPNFCPIIDMRPEE